MDSILRTRSFELPVKVDVLEKLIENIGGSKLIENNILTLNLDHDRESIEILLNWIETGKNRTDLLCQIQRMNPNTIPNLIEEIRFFGLWENDLSDWRINFEQLYTVKETQFEKLKNHIGILADCTIENSELFYLGNDTNNLFLYNLLTDSQITIPFDKGVVKKTIHEEYGIKQFYIDKNYAVIDLGNNRIKKLYLSASINLIPDNYNPENFVSRLLLYENGSCKFIDNRIGEGIHWRRIFKDTIYTSNFRIRIYFSMARINFKISSKKEIGRCKDVGFFLEKTLMHPVQTRIFKRKDTLDIKFIYLDTKMIYNLVTLQVKM